MKSEIKISLKKWLSIGVVIWCCMVALPIAIAKSNQPVDLEKHYGFSCTSPAMPNATYGMMMRCENIEVVCYIYEAAFRSKAASAGMDCYKK